MALIETTIESGETDQEYIQTQFYDKYLDVIASYMLIDTYIKQYAFGVTKQIIDATFERFSTEDKSITDDYYLSNDRAMFISECEANSILNYRQYSKAVKAGKTKKKWIDVGDKRERKTHLEVGGTTIPINEPFFSWRQSIDVSDRSFSWSFGRRDCELPVLNSIQLIRDE